MTAAATPGPGPLVLVTGAGRSGTSTVAGTLHHLGFRVPRPVLRANSSNPRGFFESRWPVRFHKRLLQEAHVEEVDGRPGAFDDVAAVIGADHRDELRDWLGRVTAEGGPVAVKDPRAVWAARLWVDCATSSGLDLGFLSMVRHPAEVIGSRQTYYAAVRPHLDAWEFAVWSLCGWINMNLLVEQHTRDQRRSVVRYTDLLADWRDTMRRVDSELGLGLAAELRRRPHAVDEFVESDLRRHAPSWDGLGLPAELVEVAEATFTGLCRLAEAGGGDPAGRTALDEARAGYQDLHRRSAAIARDVATAARSRR